MEDEGQSESDGKFLGSTGRTRRGFLAVSGAGITGGVVATGLDQFIGGDDRTDNVTVTPRDQTPSIHDVFVTEGDAGYRATDADGEQIDSGSDGWAVLEQGISAVPEGGSIRVSGDFSGTSTIQISKPIQLIGDEARVEHRTANEFVFSFAGEERQQTRLTETAETGDNTLILEDSSELQKGDMVLLEDEDGDPVLGRDHPPGEPHSVLEANDGTVTIEDSIVWREGYPPGTLAYIIDTIEVHMSGFDLEAPSKDEGYYGIAALGCRDSTFEALDLDKFGSRAIMLEACANVSVRDCNITQSVDIEASDGYGIQLWAGCHDILVEGCTAKECRHPLSVTDGGNRDVASRTITFRDCFVTADGSAALNCHGGAAHDVRFEGCMVHTWGVAGVRTGAQQTNVSGCEFRMDGQNAIHTRNDGQEMTVSVDDTDIYGATNAVKLNRDENFDLAPLWKLVQLDGVRAHGCDRFFELGSGEIDRVRNLIIKGCYFDEVSEEGLRIWNRLEGGVIEGNEFGHAPNNSHLLAVDASDTNVTGLHIVGNRFHQHDGTDPFIQLAHCDRCVVSDNRFEAGSDVRIYIDESNATANLIKENAYFAPNPSDDPIDEDEGSFAEDNRVFDTASGSWD